MTIQQIIKKAIEGGYKLPNGWSYYGEKDHLWGEHFFDAGEGEYGGRIEYNMALKVIFLDPEFWKALGKSLGWKNDKVEWHKKEKWIIEWHSFIDHLASGKSVESFFEEF